MLSDLATQLDALIDSPPLAREAVISHLFDGSLKISARLPLAGAFSLAKVELASMPKDAECEVICRPPYCLVYTPGLFEGKLQGQTQKEPTEQHQESREQSHAQRDIEDPCHDHVICHCH